MLPKKQRRRGAKQSERWIRKLTVVKFCPELGVGRRFINGGGEMESSAVGEENTQDVAGTLGRTNQGGTRTEYRRR